CVFKKHYAAAARFFRDAFTAEPQRAEAVPESSRYDAACAAALAGCGQGKDADKLADEERALWRRQSLDWLRQDLTWWGKAIDNGDAQTNAQARLRLRHWQTDPDLAGLRDEKGLADLSEPERVECQALWGRVAESLKRAAAAE